MSDVIERVAMRVKQAKTEIFGSVQDITRAGYLLCGCGLALRAAEGGATEVWAIEPSGDGAFTLVRRDDLGYEPELRSAKIEKKVIAAERGAVSVPGYGVGKRVGTSKDGGVIVEFQGPDGDAKRFVFSADVVQDIKPTTKVSVRLAARNPEKTSLIDYAEQYYIQAYGAEYGKELAKTFGALLP
jgi:hypothetical protein